jgi:hypothetical protein
MTGSRFRYHVDEFIENGVSGLTFDHRAADAEAQLGSQLLRLMTDPQLARACWMTSRLWSVCRMPRARGATSLSPIEPTDDT